MTAGGVRDSGARQRRIVLTPWTKARPENSMGFQGEGRLHPHISLSVS